MLDFAAHAQGEQGQRAPVQRDDEGTRLGIAAHRAADPQRRHAVPRRLGDDGAGRTRHRRARARPPGRADDARPRRASWPRGRGHQRVVHPHRDRPPAAGRDGEDRKARAAPCWTTSAPRRRLGADARAHAGSRRRTALAQHPGDRRGPRRGAGIPALGRRQPLHLPGLSRIHASRSKARKNSSSRIPTPASACCAARTRARRVR